MTESPILRRSTPDALGHSEEERTENLVNVLDGYFDRGAHHLNVNVFGKEKLIDAMEHPEKEEYATSRSVFPDTLLSSSTLQESSSLTLSQEPATKGCNKKYGRPEKKSLATSTHWRASALLTDQESGM